MCQTWGEGTLGPRRCKERQSCKYSWWSWQHPAPLHWLLSLHWSLIHDFHVRWPPCLTSIMWEDVPFLLACLMSVLPGDRGMLITPHIPGSCILFVIKVCTLEILHQLASFTSYIYTPASDLSDLCTQLSKYFSCPCFSKSDLNYLLLFLMFPRIPFKLKDKVL